MSVDISIASPTESQSIEVSGLMEDFISIEEFAPGSNWEEVLAASWGIPCAAQPKNLKPFLKSQSVWTATGSIDSSERAVKKA